MKKILLILIVTFSFVTLSPVWASQQLIGTDKTTSLPVTDFVQQVYEQNEYIIDQLDNIARTLKKKPYHIGARLELVGTPLLVIKLDSLNYLLEMQVEPDVASIYQPIREDLVLDLSTLKKKSDIMLHNIMRLNKKYSLPVSEVYELTNSPGLFDTVGTMEDLYQQFLQIESYFVGIKNVIEPKGVYEIVLVTRALIYHGCQTQMNLIEVPLVMGKRPKDVYVRMFDYFEMLSDYIVFEKPGRGSVHVLPHDVFDVAIIAMAYSGELYAEGSVELVVNEADVIAMLETQKPEIITPSHVYQAVSQNIEILECMSHAS